MAKVPIAEVKQAWRDALAALPELAGINVFPAWPGQDLLFVTGQPAVANWKAAVWFGPSRPGEVERHSMRADRQRRIYTILFSVLIEVQMMGESNDQNQTSSVALLQAESIAYDLWQPIDEHVADDKHLSSPSLVNFAVVDIDDTTSGYTEVGVGFRLDMPIVVNFRVL